MRAPALPRPERLGRSLTCARRGEPRTIVYMILIVAAYAPINVMGDEAPQSGCLSSGVSTKHCVIEAGASEHKPKGCLTSEAIRSIQEMGTRHAKAAAWRDYQALSERLCAQVAAGEIRLVDALHELNKKWPLAKSSRANQRQPKSRCGTDSAVSWRTRMTLGSKRPASSAGGRYGACGS